MERTAAYHIEQSKKELSAKQAARIGEIEGKLEGLRVLVGYRFQHYDDDAPIPGSPGSVVPPFNPWACLSPSGRGKGKETRQEPSRNASLRPAWGE